MIAQVFVIDGCFAKCLLQWHFLEKRNAEDLQDFAQRLPQTQLFLDDGDQNIGAYGDPDLRLDGVFGGAKKGFDA